MSFYQKYKKWTLPSKIGFWSFLLTIFALLVSFLFWYYPRIIETKLVTRFSITSTTFEYFNKDGTPQNDFHENHSVDLRNVSEIIPHIFYENTGETNIKITTPTVKIESSYGLYKIASSSLVSSSTIVGVGKMAQLSGKPIPVDFLRQGLEDNPDFFISFEPQGTYSPDDGTGTSHPLNRKVICRNKPGVKFPIFELVCNVTTN